MKPPVLPAGLTAFAWPEAYRRTLARGLVQLQPWSFLDSDELALAWRGLRERYPSREVVPFARRLDGDDVACFLPGGEVLVIHDFASPGYEAPAGATSYWEWFRAAVEDVIVSEQEA